MKKQKIKNPDEPPPDPTIEEVTRHIEQYGIQCVFWRGQNVWVVEFRQAIVAFASKLLNLNTEQDDHPTNYHRWLKYHFSKQRNYLYKDCFLKGASCPSPLGEHMLTKEEEPEDDEFDGSKN